MPDEEQHKSKCASLRPCLTLSSLGPTSVKRGRGHRLTPVRRRRRAPLRGDIGDRFATGSAKVGALPVEIAVYRANLVESRERIVSERAKASKGAGAITGGYEDEEGGAASS